jgi:hypothetical protein
MMCLMIIIQEGVGIPVSGTIKQDIINQTVTHKNKKITGRFLIRFCILILSHRSHILVFGHKNMDTLRTGTLHHQTR